MMNERLQKNENAFIIIDAKMEAFDMYNQYLDGHTLLIPKPRRGFINVYDEKTALTDDDYKRIRSEEFKRLKSLKL
jgi:diadenosine tetraphosphate (Ap4A) HIT family hydrolase